MPTTNRQKKMSITEGLSDKLGRAKSLVVTDYRGLNMVQLSELRNKLRKTDSEYTITKNTLLKRALQEKGFAVDEASLEGPSATLFAYGDEVAPIKELVAYAKTAALPKVKAGYLGKDFLNSARVDALAKLPSRQMLLGQTVGVLQAPVSAFVNVLQANIRNLVYVLNQVATGNR